MSTLKFITFNDVHVSAINPASRIGNYEGDIFNKLDQIKKIGNAVGASFYVFAGDLFHLKAPMRNPHALNSKLIELFSSFPGPIYTTEGNHDLKYDSYDTFGDQPLNVIYKSKVLLKTRDTIQQFGDFRVRIRSFPFQEEPELSEYPKAGKGDWDFSICLLHLYASRNGGLFFYHKLYSYEEISQLGDDIFVIGHYHIDQGIERMIFDGRERIYINVGAISRGTLSEDDTNRSPKVGYITVEKNSGGCTFKCNTVTLKVKPISEVFDLEKKEEEKKRSKEIEEFVARLEVDSEEIIDGEDKVKGEIQRLNLDRVVLDKVLYFLEEADLKRKNIAA